MASVARPTPACVYLLADHLDAMLAAGEDLTRVAMAWKTNQAANAENVPLRRLDDRERMDELRTLELLIIARILQARDRAHEVAELSDFFSSLSTLFAAGTSYLRDIVEECGDSTVADFTTGDGITSYLRSRAMLSAEAPCVASDTTTFATREQFEERFLVAGRQPLKTLLDNAATFLDALDLHYELYEDTVPTFNDDEITTSALIETTRDDDETKSDRTRPPTDTLAERLSRLQ